MRIKRYVHTINISILLSSIKIDVFNTNYFDLFDINVGRTISLVSFMNSMNMKK